MKQGLWAQIGNSEEQQGLERTGDGLPTRMATSFKSQLLRLHSQEPQRPRIVLGQQKQFSQELEWKTSFPAALGRRYWIRVPPPPRHSWVQHREPRHSQKAPSSHRSSCPWKSSSPQQQLYFQQSFSPPHTQQSIVLILPLNTVKSKYQVPFVPVRYFQTRYTNSSLLDWL